MVSPHKFFSCPPPPSRGNVIEVFGLQEDGLTIIISFSTLLSVYMVLSSSLLFTSAFFILVVSSLFPVGFYEGTQCMHHVSLSIYTIGVEKHFLEDLKLFFPALFAMES